ncbi:unnamed protein product (macronuclear) [Paramecium tetraurelia]|uniref:Uncharacterized protein n=1 Tax=Paramecium tetraurelia TaxID=5888 RepID=A0BKR7_PARTE|nr:uncharacterized protein GSPATT00029765001 [Paramecium tetraurelia]CAK59134.1 unnamed protein product [Paramecium tetraurelia]|eukprot:XP_001426532.1 hypothetical protein (macronuclear) [Paramecium tetraurelia strain d4-2]
MSQSDSDNKAELSEDYDDDFVEEKPIEPRPYKTPHDDETIQDILSLYVKDRPLIKMQFIKKRKEFGLTFKFSDQETSERTGEIKALDKDPLQLVKNKVIDMGIQGCNPVLDASSQTVWNRKINKALQVDEGDERQEQPDEDFKLLKFLETVYPLMEEALQSNETIDIYQDDFNVLPSSDLNGDQNAELTNVIKEIKSFSYLNCKGKKIQCIQFQPSSQAIKSKYIVAESFVENLLFEERVISQLKSHKSLVVFWDFEDIHSIEPVLLLQSPLEILAFEFNPKDPNIIIGGAINGQVMLWDLSGTALSVFASKKTQKTKQERNEIQELLPKMTSALQDPASYQAAAANDVLKKQVASHKSPALALKWFPIGMEFDKKHFNHLILTTSQETYQFASISADGQILFWDTRLIDKDSKKTQQDISSIPWKATYGIQLYRPEGGGMMGGGYLQFRKNQKTPTLSGTSDEGEVFILDWGERQGEEGQKNQLVTTIWQQARSMRPPIALDVSPFFDDIILTLHDFNFCVWKHNSTQPIFDSLILKGAHITCGGFSPFRAGVIIIGKTDGNLDVWDMLDQSHKWTLQFQVVACAITSLKFNDNMAHIVAVGDSDGTLHLLEFPQSLCKDQGNEIKVMRQFWDREVRRVNYYQERFKLREQQAKEQNEKEILAQAMKETKQPGDTKVLDEISNFESEYQKFRDTLLGIAPKVEDEKGISKQKK